ncbi:hypothetical protein FLN19_22650 [Salmonella enterica]|nr:hypothetical protein [Salmonella enterica]
MVSGRSRGRGVTQYVDENAADGVAHVVFPDRSAPVRFRKILLRRKPDLCGGERACNMIIKQLT